jgi:hypothetical protein
MWQVSLSHLSHTSFPVSTGFEHCLQGFWCKLWTWLFYWSLSTCWDIKWCLKPFKSLNTLLQMWQGILLSQWSHKSLPVSIGFEQLLQHCSDWFFVIFCNISWSHSLLVSFFKMTHVDKCLSHLSHKVSQVSLVTPQNRQFVVDTFFCFVIISPIFLSTLWIFFKCFSRLKLKPKSLLHKKQEITLAGFCFFSFKFVWIVETWFWRLSFLVNLMSQWSQPNIFFFSWKVKMWYFRLDIRV